MKGWIRKLRRHTKRLKLPVWQLAVLFAVSLLMSVFFLRQNNLEMVRLRDKVVQADALGIGLEPALADLRQHVFSHMNTTIVRPIELVETYNRRVEALVIAATQDTGRDVYAEAAGVCERRGVPLTSIAQCAAEYASTNINDVSTKINLPNKSLFTHSFITPRWTPDLAGFSVLLTGVIGLWLTVRVIELLLVRLVVRRRLRRRF